MNEYRIKWAQVPMAHNPSRVMFVEAESEEGAKAIATEHIERQYGVGWFGFREVAIHKPPSAAGKVISG